MSDPATRQDVVEANTEAVEAKYGSLEYMKILISILKDISVSLAMLVDAGSGT